MKFKVEVWQSCNIYEEIIIDAVDALYATKFARWMWPKATKINIKKV